MKNILTISNIRAGLPKEGFNRYDIFKVVKWNNNRLEKTSETKDLEQANIRIKNAMAEKLETENKEKSKKLIEREIMFQILENIFSNIRNKLMGSPNKIAYQVYGSKDIAEAKQKTKNVIIDALNELSNPEILFKEQARRFKPKH